MKKTIVFLAVLVVLVATPAVAQDGWLTRMTNGYGYYGPTERWGYGGKWELRNRADEIRAKGEAAEGALRGLGNLYVIYTQPRQVAPYYHPYPTYSTSTGDGWLTGMCSPSQPAVVVITPPVREVPPPQVTPQDSEVQKVETELRELQQEIEKEKKLKQLRKEIAKAQKELAKIKDP